MPRTTPGSPAAPAGRSGVAVSGVRYEAPREARRLAGVDLVAAPGELVAVIGASGAGKSTLLEVLAGLLPATAGEGGVAGSALDAPVAQRAGRVGHVPQAAALHEELTARAELRLAAGLRGLDADATGTAVARALDTVQLTAVADRPIGTLSGGERRRVSVAVELLGDPDVLLLDEPTSGLDPVNEYVVLRQLRAIADAGRAVVLATHSIAHLAACDRLLVLAEGGVVVASGRPDELLAAAGASSFVQLFPAVPGTPPGGPPVAALLPPATRAPGRRPPLGVLVHREALRLRAAWRSTALLLVMAPVFGAFVRSLVTVQGMDNGILQLNLGARRIVLTLVLSAVWMGSVDAVREIVKDRAVIRRERPVGVRPAQVVAAKVAVLAPLTAVQALLLTAVALAGVPTVDAGAALPWVLLEVAVDVWACAFAGACVALLISAAARGTDRALGALALVLVPQIVLSGGVMTLGDAPALEALAAVAPARWGLSAVASSIDLRGLETTTEVPVPLSSDAVAVVRHEDADGGWDHVAGAWLGDVGALGGLGVLALAGTVVLVRRRQV
jgi:ABC-type multidrug transport system ATPase subunit